jgi:hypothetical protein
LKLEINEMIDESGLKKIFNFFSDFLSGALNSFSSRSVSFIVPVEGKRSINSFFKLLDSSGKSIEMF